MKQEAMFTIKTKNPRFILSYGINLEGPTLKNPLIPKHAENTDKRNVTSVCRLNGSSDSGPRKTIAIIRWTCGNDSRNGSANKELCDFLKELMNLINNISSWPFEFTKVTSSQLLLLSELCSFSPSQSTPTILF